MATLYVTYSIMTDRGTGVGRATIDGSWSGGGAPPQFRLSEITALESKLLATAKENDPSSTNLFLLDWKWLRDEAPSESPSTKEASDA